MSNIEEYGKIFFISNDGKGRLIQPKSYTSATKTEEKTIISLLMEGDYVIVKVAMPRTLKEMK